MLFYCIVENWKSASPRKAWPLHRRRPLLHSCAASRLLALPRGSRGDSFGDLADAPSSHAFILGQRLEVNSLECR